MKARHNVYEFGDKANRLLALQVRQAVTKIQSHTGEILTDHNDMNKDFLQFYTNLYTLECDDNPDLTRTFFENLTIPTMSVFEIITAIKSMQNNKSPGPDRFTYEFYKMFAPQLAPTLEAMFKEALSLGILPITLRQASISLLVKKDRDPLLYTSYHPISLLNVDFLKKNI